MNKPRWTNPVVMASFPGFMCGCLAMLTPTKPSDFQLNRRVTVAGAGCGCTLEPVMFQMEAGLPSSSLSALAESPL